MIRKIFRYIFSFVFQQKVDKYTSTINGILEVNYSGGKFVLDTINANYSFGGLHAIFQKSFHQFNLKKRNINKVLVLGFGAGSVVSILQEEYKMDVSITGVEMDEAVIELAKKYFSMDKYKNLTIVCDDAYNFIINLPPVTYSLIVVDVFVDLMVPEKITQEEFIAGLNKFLLYDGILFYNFIARDEKTRNTGAHVYKFLNQYIGHTEWMRLFAENTENWMFVSQKSKNIN